MATADELVHSISFPASEVVGVSVGDDDGLDVAGGAPRPRQPLVEITPVAKEACIHQGHTSA